MHNDDDYNYKQQHDHLSDDNNNNYRNVASRPNPKTVASVVKRKRELENLEVLSELHRRSAEQLGKHSSHDENHMFTTNSEGYPLHQYRAPNPRPCLLMDSHTDQIQPTMSAASFLKQLQKTSSSSSSSSSPSSSSSNADFNDQLYMLLPDFEQFIYEDSLSDARDLFLLIKDVVMERCYTDIPAVIYAVQTQTGRMEHQDLIKFPALNNMSLLRYDLSVKFMMCIAIIPEEKKGHHHPPPPPPFHSNNNNHSEISFLFKNFEEEDSRSSSSSNSSHSSSSSSMVNISAVILNDDIWTELLHISKDQKTTTIN